MHHLPKDGMIAYRNGFSTESAGRVLDGGKGLGKHFLKGFPIPVALHEFGRFGFQLVVGKALVLLFDPIDFRNDRGAFFEVLAMGSSLEGIQYRFERC